MVQNVFSQSDCRIFQSTISPPHFLHLDTNSHKLNVDQKIFGWVYSKVGVGSLVTGLLTVSQEERGRINWSFGSWCKSGKPEVQWFLGRHG